MEEFDYGDAPADWNSINGAETEHQERHWKEPPRHWGQKIEVINTSFRA